MYGQLLQGGTVQQKRLYVLSDCTWCSSFHPSLTRSTHEFEHGISLESRSNAHSNITKYLTRASCSNTGTVRMYDRRESRFWYLEGMYSEMSVCKLFLLLQW